MPLPASTTHSLGATLRAAREARGASIEDASRALKLSVAQIQAIEADDYSQLPSPIFVRGFIRTYARLLDVDVTAMLPAKQPEMAPSDERLMHHRPGVSLEPRRGFSLPAMFGGAMCLLAALAYYEFVINAPPEGTRITASVPSREAPFVTAEARQGDARLADSLAPATAALPVQASVAPTVADNLRLKKSEDPASGAGEKGLHFQFNGESWVEVRGSDGKVVFSMVNAPGSERIVRGNPPFTLVIGGASGVQLSYNGSRVDLASYVTSDVARLRLE